MARPIAPRRGQVVWIDAKLSAAVGGAEGSEVTRRVQAIVRRALGLHPDTVRKSAHPDDPIVLPLPCPWCGGARGVVEQVERFGPPPVDADPDEGWWAFSVRCTSCAAVGPWTKVSADAAVRAWCRRPLPGVTDD